VSKKNKIAVDFNQLSEKSRKSITIPEFYEDEAIKCVDCGETFIFTAATQKQWYEKDKRYFWQRPIRCSKHHEIWKKARFAKERMDGLLEEAKVSKSDNAKLECAESIIEYRELTGHGNLLLAKKLLKSLESNKAKSKKLAELENRILLLERTLRES
jgi:hypothetical protein